MTYVIMNFGEKERAKQTMPGQMNKLWLVTFVLSDWQEIRSFNTRMDMVQRKETPETRKTKTKQNKTKLNKSNLENS